MNPLRKALAAIAGAALVLALGAQVAPSEATRVAAPTLTRTQGVDGAVPAAGDRPVTPNAAAAYVGAFVAGGATVIVSYLVSKIKGIGTDESTSLTPDQINDQVATYLAAS